MPKINTTNFVSDGLTIPIKPSDFYIDGYAHSRCGKILTTTLGIPGQTQGKYTHYIRDIENDRQISTNFSYSFWEIDGVKCTSNQDLIDKMNTILVCAEDSGGSGGTTDITPIVTELQKLTAQEIKEHYNEEDTFPLTFGAGEYSSITWSIEEGEYEVDIDGKKIIYNGGSYTFNTGVSFLTTLTITEITAGKINVLAIRKDPSGSSVLGIYEGVYE